MTAISTDSVNNPAGLTEAEITELAERPVIEELQDFTEEQLVRRVEIAKKYCTFFSNADLTMSLWSRTLYDQYPIWGFYVDGTCMKRAYGVSHGANGDRVHTATCMFLMTNLTVGGTPVADLTRVNRWTDAQKASACLNPTPGTFLDPLGFMNILRLVAPR
jgi:hypothetical protein